MIFHHGIIDSSGGSSLSELNIRHHQVLLVGVPKHVLKIPLKLAPEKEPSSNFLDFYDLLSPLIEVYLDVVSRPISSVETLDEYTRRIPLKNSSETIYVDLKVKKMLLSTLFFGVVRNVEFHELIETSEPVAE